MGKQEEGEISVQTPPPAAPGKEYFGGYGLFTAGGSGNNQNHWCCTFWLTPIKTGVLPHALTHFTNSRTQMTKRKSREFGHNKTRNYRENSCAPWANTENKSVDCWWSNLKHGEHEAKSVEEKALDVPVYIDLCHRSNKKIIWVRGRGMSGQKDHIIGCIMRAVEFVPPPKHSICCAYVQYWASLLSRGGTLPPTPTHTATITTTDGHNTAHHHQHHYRTESGQIIS